MMLKKSITIALIAAAGFTMVSEEAPAFFGRKKSKSEVVQVTGSDTIVNLSQHISEAYMGSHNDARIAVTGGGSGVGIAAAINGTTDIAMASRDAKGSELKSAADAGRKLEEIVIGWDGIGVVTHKNNPVNTLSMEAIGKIFSGEITNWSEVGGKDAPIVILSRDSSSGTHVYFKEAVVRGGEDNNKEYANETLYLPSNSAIMQETANNVNAIGYVGMGYLDESVNIVSVDGIAPTVGNVSSKVYPVARELFWYTPLERTEVITNIINFALSPEGQEIVAKEGFVPAR